MVNPILTTKLFMPTSRPDIVFRPLLIQKINQGLAQGCKLTLVSAPAGYGKTTLITEWLKTLDRGYAWLSMDAGDNNPQRFFTYLVAALQTIVKELGEEVGNLLRSPQLPAPETIATLLINQVVDKGESIAMVLDDYHLITNEYLNRTLEFIIENSPDIFHIVIATRHDPVLPLGRWRGRNKLTELRIDDLRFNDKEAEAFFSQTMQLSLKDSHVFSLKNRTEGWIAGLQLAALSLRGREERGVNEFVEKFSGSHRYVIDYLFEEVLRLQKDEIKEFLCKTAVLGRMCPSLCDELMGRNDTKNILISLEQTNLFLIPLDEKRQWYRYHHLFADFLRTELKEEQEPGLHQKASEWFESNGYKTEAIEHSLAAGDVDNAVRQIKEQTNNSLMNGELFTLIGWLDSLPEKLVRDDSELCSYKACAHFLVAQIDKALYYINVFRQIKQVDRLSDGRVKALEAWFANIREDKITIELATEAIDLMGDEDLGLKVFALVALAQVQRSTGNLTESTKAFTEALKISTDECYSLSVCTVLMDLVYNYYIQGNLQKAIQLCLDTLEGKSTGSKPLPEAGILNIPLSLFYYETNRLKLAEKTVNKAIDACRRMAMSKIFGGDAERTLARIRYLQGCPEEALTILQEGLKGAKASGLSIAALRFEGIQADLLLRMGKVSRVEEWIKRSGLSLEDELTSLKEQPYLVYVRFLLTQKLWPEAQALLAKLEKFSRGQRKGRLINILVLKAILKNTLGDADEAKRILGEAVSSAAPQNYRRSFLEEGEQVFKMLPFVQDYAPEFVAGLIEDFKLELSLCPEVKPTNAAVGLIESLSDREIEVLRLVAAGLSNADISRKLFISLGTVKWHINHIFAKLGVKNRTQAVNKAKELEII
ncbi:MAG TPA: LuxR C-terminal-related transcriptional regulator [Desulfobacteria bacterium]|nr:LuxR C-terminal-related transcriptional regulator [Desulfobacteria bacterium]